MSPTDEFARDRADLASRRELLLRLGSAVLGAAAVTRGGRVRAAAPPAAPQVPVLSEEDPAAKAVRYVADAARAKGATAGSTCANCSLYQGKYGSREGPCQILPGKQVAAAGWCASWAPQM